MVVVVAVIVVLEEAEVIREVKVIVVVTPMVDIPIIMQQQTRQVALGILCMEK